uniref:Uncharacterized protein n=1 Tax=Rhizophora mucronata TaxID=61149 RepID=A0A2P2KE30_RHIMU
MISKGEKRGCYNTGFGCLRPSTTSTNSSKFITLILPPSFKATSTNVATPEIMPLSTTPGTILMFFSSSAGFCIALGKLTSMTIFPRSVITEPSFLKADRISGTPPRAISRLKTGDTATGRTSTATGILLPRRWTTFVCSTNIIHTFAMESITYF